jgi:hypothetical protein
MQTIDRALGLFRQVVPRLVRACGSAEAAEAYLREGAE